MIRNLRLRHYRSYSDATFEFNPSVNIIVGPNASGKTNLLEAVLMIARGGSYRAKDAELINFGAPWSRLDAELDDGGLRSLKLVVEPLPSKTFEVNKKAYKRLPSPQHLPIVLFEPNHLLMLTGGPERRREYLDDLLEQTIPGYKSVRLQYRRALAQRNNLLKQSTVNSSQLFPWNVRLSQLAGQMFRERQRLIDSINETISPLYQELSQTKTELVIRYQTPLPTVNYETAMLNKLETTEQLDRQRGFTTTGPHREDFVLLFDDRPTNETASRGETRTAILALKIIELKNLEAKSDARPILLLDDVFSELDAERRQALTNYLAPYQTFITTTDADLVSDYFAETNTNTLHIKR